MEPADDRVLLAKAATGDARAIEAFVRRWEAPLYRFLRRTTGCPAMAEEARQLTFLRVLARAGEHRGGSVSVWLFRTAWRMARNAMRSASPRRLRPLEEAASLSAPDRGPEAEAVEAESRAALHRGLARLAPGERALLWLRVGQGLSIEECARVLGAPASTLRYRLERTLRRLRRELHAPLDEGPDPFPERHEPCDAVT